MPFTKTFHGFIENTTDSLLIIEACRNGLLPTINRRLIERERHTIKSGTIIVFDETESGIKRWTDGFLWSPSRILGNFLVYRELENRDHRRINDAYSYPSIASAKITDEANISLIQQKEKALVGSLTTLNTTYNFKNDGLIKKTIRIMVNGSFLHIVNYYSKHDVLNSLLPTPSASPELACLQISADLMPHLQGHNASFLPPRDITLSRKRSKSSDESDYQQQVHSNNNDSNKAYRINYSNFVYSTTTTSSNSSNNSAATYPVYDNLYGRPPTSISSGLTTSVFDTYSYQYNNKRIKTSQDTLSPSLSPTPPPPIILSTSSSCGDTVILANRFNQFYSPTNTNISNRNPINNNSSSTFDCTSPRRTTVFDKY